VLACARVRALRDRACEETSHLSARERECRPFRLREQFIAQALVLQRERERGRERERERERERARGREREEEREREREKGDALSAHLLLPYRVCRLCPTSKAPKSRLSVPRSEPDSERPLISKASGGRSLL
jgi:hypothetical protein